jgi:hypothetical protein
MAAERTNLPLISIGGADHQAVIARQALTTERFARMHHLKLAFKPD